MKPRQDRRREPGTLLGKILKFLDRMIVLLLSMAAPWIAAYYIGGYLLEK